MKLAYILGWLENQLDKAGDGFFPDYVSMQDIFLAAHVRFVQARPLGIELSLHQYENVASLVDRLDKRASFIANPVWWWEPGVTGYQPDGTPVFNNETK